MQGAPLDLRERTPVRMMYLEKWEPLKLMAIRLLPFSLSWMTEGDHTANGLKGKLRHNCRVSARQHATQHIDGILDICTRHIKMCYSAQFLAS